MKAGRRGGGGGGLQSQRWGLSLGKKKKTLTKRAKLRLLVVTVL